MKNRSLLITAFAFVLGCVISALVVGRELHPTYYEANDLLSALWKSNPSNNFEDPTEFSIHDLVPEKFVNICQFSSTGGNVVDYVKSQHSLRAETFVRGNLINDWDTEHLYKILFVAADGDAIIWNFDERLYEIDRYDKSTNCFKTKDISILVNSKKLSENNITTLIKLIRR